MIFFKLSPSLQLSGYPTKCCSELFQTFWSKQIQCNVFVYNFCQLDGFQTKRSSFRLYKSIFVRLPQPQFSRLWMPTNKSQLNSNPINIFNHVPAKEYLSEIDDIRGTDSFFPTAADFDQVQTTHHINPIKVTLWLCLRPIIEFASIVMAFGWL